MNRSYSTTDLAKLWGVSESSIKRWADAGTIKCYKTAGGHRKFNPEDVLEFQARSGLAAKSLALSAEFAPRDFELKDILAEPDLTDISQRYKKEAINGQCLTASTLIRETYLHGIHLPTIAEEIIKPALYEIGEMWRAGKLEVFEEHLATFATMQALAGLNSASPKELSVDRLALVGCLENEHHEIASAMARCLLLSEGWSVIYMGTHTPLFSFADAINKLKPGLACISATMTDNLERAARDYKMLRRAASKQGTGIIMGGQALNDDLMRARFKGAYFANTLYALEEIIHQVMREW